MQLLEFMELHRSYLCYRFGVGGVNHTSAVNICDNPVIFLKDISCDNSFYYRITAALLASRAERSRCLFHFTKEKQNKNTHMFESRIIFFYM